MRVMLVHNYYQQPGGEDRSFEAEAALLQENGHLVDTYSLHNDAIRGMSRIGVAARSVWNCAVYRDLRERFNHTQYDIVHFQNTFPQISPSGYYAARDAGVPVIQSLRNYRLSCVNGLFYRDGRVCEDCVGRTVPWPGVLHACYRKSRSGSAAVAAMLTYHNLRGTFHKVVNQYIALSEFSRQKFIEIGLAPQKIAVKPNFLTADPGIGSGRGRYALFVGRLSEEKGVATLIAAWRRLHNALPLKIVGDGPLADSVRSAQGVGIEWVGYRSPAEVFELMGEARFLVFPSEWYETFGRVAIEAFAKGTPVVVSRIGAIAELVEHGRTGLHFAPGDPADLATKVQWMLNHPVELENMRREARAEYEAKYTPEKNYRMLMEIYEATASVRHL